MALRSEDTAKIKSQKLTHFCKREKQYTQNMVPDLTPDRNKARLEIGKNRQMQIDNKNRSKRKVLT